MKNLKINKALIPIITSLVLVTTGCNNKTNEVIEDNTINQTTENNTSTTNEVENNEVQETFDNFTTEKNEISDLINKKNFEEAKEKGKEFFINGVDFIFYDKEYKGITFDDLKEEAKEETLNNLNIIDGWIMQLDPDYKETLQEKYKVVSDFVNEKYLYVLDKIKEYLGEENYNAITDIKNKLKNDLSNFGNNLSDNIKNKANEWYENFKNDSKTK